MQLTFLPLFFFAFLAGFIDSIVGGGGLIQLPALLIFLPQYPLTTVFGTNKLVSITGTGISATQYARHIAIPWRAALLTATAAFCCSFLGASVVSLINPAFLRPFIIVLLMVIALYIFFKKDFGDVQTLHLSPRQQLFFGLAAGAVIGFYDGFFGPGTGTFLIFAFIGFLGYNFLTATASAKVVNFATNLAAILFFLFNGSILFQVALPMMIFNVLGALTGTRLAILKGNRFVRLLFLFVVCAVIFKLVWDTFGLHI
jgi:uncharacterized membrane protein YfcA